MKKKMELLEYVKRHKDEFFEYDYVINVQGDMLDITYETIEPIIKQMGAHRNVITDTLKDIIQME